MQVFKRTDGQPNLIIFALGWGADPSTVAHIPSFPGFDTLILYDYRGVEPLGNGFLAGYEKIILFAWSFGVWASEQILKEAALTKAVALNGTPLPVDDRYGIPLRAFRATLRGIASAGPETFNRRAYGECYDKMAASLDGRPWNERLEELEKLYGISSVAYEPAIKWSDALIGSRDGIFPPDNMLAYWQPRMEPGRLTVADLPHYPFGCGSGSGLESEPGGVEILSKYLEPNL